MRTELSEGAITIQAYEPGIELAVFEAARESVPEIGPSMRTWREGATYEKAAQHVAESVHAYHQRIYWFLIQRSTSLVVSPGSVRVSRYARWLNRIPLAGHAILADRCENLPFGADAERRRVGCAGGNVSDHQRLGLIESPRSFRSSTRSS
jgi:hypothetical protein